MKIARTLPPSAAPIDALDVALTAANAFRPAAVRARVTAQLKAFLGVDQLFLVSSGKAALTVTLQAVKKLRGGGRVLIPAYTCYSVPAAVVRAGLEPILFDIDPRTLDFDEASLRRGLTQPGVVAVVPTHLFGVPSDVARVRALANPSGIVVIEDAAQALGVTDREGRQLGTLGDVGVFSFARGKHLTSGGGGMIVSRSAVLGAACAGQCAELPGAGGAASLKLTIELAMMSVFSRPWLYWLPAGLPFLKLGETTYETDFPISDMATAAVAALSRWRPRLERANRARREVVDAWQREPGLPALEGRQGPLLRFPVVLPSGAVRDHLLENARNAGLGVSTMYPNPVHRVPELRERFEGQRFPGAEAIAARLITLPTHAYVDASDRARFSALWRAELASWSASDVRAVKAG